MATVSPILEHRKHDHGRCTADAISHAREICDAEGLRFTDRRREVLAALLESHVPASAYEVIDRLGETGHRPAPVSVYRALDFLVEHRFAHRIESRNAYVACDRGADCDDEATLFLLCEKCAAPGEASSAALHALIADVTGAVDFAPKAPVVEIRGLCAGCR
ncbi:MAG: transcriptional repressor [Bauldia litoralis]|uniref:Fur family transcriptional regulator n=1 Tax=Bauldia litoralis TaxID=665467 RepID=UPI0032967DA3